MEMFVRKSMLEETANKGLSSYGEGDRLERLKYLMAIGKAELHGCQAWAIMATTI